MALSSVPTIPDTRMLESQSQFGTVLESKHDMASGSGEELRRKVAADNTGASLEEDFVTKLQLVEEKEKVHKLQLVEEKEKERCPKKKRKKEKEHFCKLCHQRVDICDCPYLKGEPSDCGPTYDVCCSYCRASLFKRRSKPGEGLANAYFCFHCVNKGEQWVNRDGYDYDSDAEAEFLSKYPNAVE